MVFVFWCVCSTLTLYHLISFVTLTRCLFAYLYLFLYFLLYWSATVYLSSLLFFQPLSVTNNGSSLFTIIIECVLNSHPIWILIKTNEKNGLNFDAYSAVAAIIISTMNRASARVREWYRVLKKKRETEKSPHGCRRLIIMIQWIDDLLSILLWRVVVVNARCYTWFVHPIIMAYMKSMHNRFKVDSNVITVVAINGWSVE